ncbi:hypothetical protein GCM10007216_11160 [Thalassobacillus devorans]|uniref:Uncharacterized protein n=1 Tax=Thalassobacillus devorans TaxID=279813 RepID=A0ABQ1NPW0_9BACI|nr:hypothetical protein GCM10007216_11160 [Thalassobacillus devorans]
MFITKLLRYKILYTELIAEDRRIHVFDMAFQRKLSFNYASLKRSPDKRAKELLNFLKSKNTKIELGLYDNKGRAS